MDTVTLSRKSDTQGDNRRTLVVGDNKKNITFLDLKNITKNVNNMSEIPTRIRSKEKTDMSLNLRAATGQSGLARAKKTISSSTTQINTIGGSRFGKSPSKNSININENDRVQSLANSDTGIPKTPTPTPQTPDFDLDDMNSVYSMATTSGRCTMSCEHPYVARNGTTFSGRQMQYIIHSSHYAGQVGADYLTPTQRAQRQLRKLKEILSAARKDLEHKDTEIMRLTREVVELRLFKASLTSPEERSASSDAVTVRENDLKTSLDVSPIVQDLDMLQSKLTTSNVMQQPQPSYEMQMQTSYADSGHFEDMSSTSQHDGGRTAEECHNQNVAEYELELKRVYEQRIEDLIRSQDAENFDLKRTHNEKIEALLQKLSECNTRYANIVPDYDFSKARIFELEKQVEDLQRKLIENEENAKKIYLHMYQQHQDNQQIAKADQTFVSVLREPNKVSINELLQQLQNTQDELENIRTIYRSLVEAQKNRIPVDKDVTLQFLKSAIYYFLTDKENSQGHLRAIESILEFTEAEKQNIARSQK